MATENPMDVEEYYVEIIRDKLSGFEGRVSDEEAGGSIFVSNEQIMLEGKLVNLAKFRALDLDMPDTTPRFVELGKTPAESTVEWTGVVLVGGVLTAAEMFRNPLPQE